MSLDPKKIAEALNNQADSIRSETIEIAVRRVADAFEEMAEAEEANAAATPNDLERWLAGEDMRDAREIVAAAIKKLTKQVSTLEERLGKLEGAWEREQDYQREQRERSE